MPGDGTYIIDGIDVLRTARRIRRSTRQYETRTKRYLRSGNGYWNEKNAVRASPWFESDEDDVAKPRRSLTMRVKLRTVRLR